MNALRWSDIRQTEKNERNRVAKTTFEFRHRREGHNGQRKRRLHATMHALPDERTRFDQRDVTVEFCVRACGFTMGVDTDALLFGRRGRRLWPRLYNCDNGTVIHQCSPD